MTPRPITLIALTLLLLFLTATATTASAADDTPLITPSTPLRLHDLKLLYESLQESAATTPQEKLITQSKHLDNRLSELKADTKNGNTKHTEKLLLKIQQKQDDITATLQDLVTSCPDCITDTYRQKLNNHSTQVLTGLLTSPDMPQQSKKGLSNALNHSTTKLGKSIKVTANQAQAFGISKQSATLIPFTQAMYLHPLGTWYSVVITDTAAILSDKPLVSPDYYLYPTQEQMDKLTAIYKNINTHGKLGWKDTVQLTILWMNVKKTETQQQEN